MWYARFLQTEVLVDQCLNAVLAKLGKHFVDCLQQRVLTLGHADGVGVNCRLVRLSFGALVVERCALEVTLALNQLLGGEFVNDQHIAVQSDVRNRRSKRGEADLFRVRASQRAALGKLVTEEQVGGGAVLNCNVLALQAVPVDADGAVIVRGALQLGRLVRTISTSACRVSSSGVSGS